MAICKFIAINLDECRLRAVVLGKSALQIFPVVGTPVSRCVYICKCLLVIVCVTFSLNVYCRLVKILKNHTIEDLQSNGTSSVLVLLDFDLHLRGQTFCILLVLRMYRKWFEIEQTLLLS